MQGTCDFISSEWCPPQQSTRKKKYANGAKFESRTKIAKRKGAEKRKISSSGIVKLIMRKFGTRSYIRTSSHVSGVISMLLMSRLALSINFLCLVIEIVLITLPVSRRYLYLNLSNIRGITPRHEIPIDLTHFGICEPYFYRPSVVTIDVSRSLNYDHYIHSTLGRGMRF